MRAAVVSSLAAALRLGAAQLHIEGARSMPLRELADRKAEIPKTGPVVFY